MSRELKLLLLKGCQLMLGILVVAAAGWWTYPQTVAVGPHAWPLLMREIAWGQFLFYAVTNWRLLRTFGGATSFGWEKLGFPIALVPGYLWRTAIMTGWMALMLLGAFDWTPAMRWHGGAWALFVVASFSALSICSRALDLRLLLQDCLMQATYRRLDAGPPSASGWSST